MEITGYAGDYRIFRENPNMAYLDNAATTQRPDTVIEAVKDFYMESNANPYRGVYDLSHHATEAYRDARQMAAQFIASRSEEIVFTRNTTDGINLAVRAYCTQSAQRRHSAHKLNIVTTVAEHHSVFVTAQQIAKELGLEFRVAKQLDVYGGVETESILSLIDTYTVAVVVSYAGNVLGNWNDIRTIADKAHDEGAVIIVDAAQSVAHRQINVDMLDADFLAFSGHKMYGPMGIGVLYGKQWILDSVRPITFGGGAITSVHEDETIFACSPRKFEPGTPNVAGAVGLAEAIRYILSIGWSEITETEKELGAYMYDVLNGIRGVDIYGEQGGTICSFNVKGVHAHDEAEICSDYSVCIRAGNHCAQPLMEAMGLPGGAARSSLCFYNTKWDIDMLALAIEKAKVVFGSGKIF